MANRKPHRRRAVIRAFPRADKPSPGQPDKLPDVMRSVLPFARPASAARSGAPLASFVVPHRCGRKTRKLRQSALGGDMIWLVDHGPLGHRHSLNRGMRERGAKVGVGKSLAACRIHCFCAICLSLAHQARNVISEICLIENIYYKIVPILG